MVLRKYFFQFSNRVDKRIALISHDWMKKELITLVEKHKKTFKKHIFLTTCVPHPIKTLLGMTAKGAGKRPF